MQCVRPTLETMLGAGRLRPMAMLLMLHCLTGCDGDGSRTSATATSPGDSTASATASTSTTTGEEIGTQETGGDRGLCLPFTHGSEAECPPDDVCVPVAERMVVRGTESVGLRCSSPADCRATGDQLQQFTYRGESSYAHLRFTSGIVDNYSTEAFNKYFDSAVIGISFEVGDFYNLGGSNVKPGEITFEYVDGRLHFSHSGDKVVAYYELYPCAESGCNNICEYRLEFDWVQDYQLVVQSAG